MNLEVKGVHYHVSENTQDHIDKKMKRFQFAEELIQDLGLTITKTKKDYVTEANIHFRWGQTDHIRVESFKLYEGLDNLFDKLDSKVRKEKDKIQTHQ